MSSWGIVKGGCPQCESDAEWYDFGNDCRGNRGSSGVNCVRNCHWTDEQKAAFWSDLFEKQIQNYGKTI